MEVTKPVTAIRLKNISNKICKKINLTINGEEMLVLAGPTGAGKTTLLNIIAGLDNYSGNIYFDGRPIDKVPPRQRGIGYLFQDLALFPHLNVYFNVAYGLIARKKSLNDIEEKVVGLLKLLNIEHLKDRYPKNLSGGEKQKVALARTLAISPKVLLLDEPFSNIDLQTRKYLRIEVKNLQKKLKITTVFVTHNLIEAEEMGDRIAIMCEQEIQQVTSPKDLMFSPKNEKVANFIGKPNILKCDYCRSLEGEIAKVKCGGISLVVPYEGKKIEKILIFPRDIYVSPIKPPTSVMNGHWGIITEIMPLSSLVRFKVKVKNNILLAELPKDLFYSLGLKSNKRVFLILKFRGIRVW